MMASRLLTSSSSPRFLAQLLLGSATLWALEALAAPPCPESRQQRELTETQRQTPQGYEDWEVRWREALKLNAPLLSAAEVNAHNQALRGDQRSTGHAETHAESATPPPSAFTPRAALRALIDELERGERAPSTTSALLRSALTPLGFEFKPRVERGVGSVKGRGWTGGQTFSIDLKTIESTNERAHILDAAFTRGLTLITRGDQVGVYLGRDERGSPSALFSRPRYHERCKGESGETEVQLTRPAIVSLHLGEETEAGSYLKRAERILVIGQAPGPAIGLTRAGGLAELRAPVALVKPERRPCWRTKNRARIFTSPRTPNAKQPTRFMITRPERDTPAMLALYGPNGEVITPELTRLGGPPYTYYSAPIELKRGEWRAAYGEGRDLHACTHIKVKRTPKPPKEEEHIWTPQEEWSAHTEALYAAFVERLFQYPLEEDRTWTNLQDLLNVKDKNLLYHHLSSNEEAALKLQPDCADLPYTLRAYFAWKLRLPFSYMTCTRGSKRRPPKCQERMDSRQPREKRKVGRDFQWFARRGVAGHVHSSSARTVPDDDETELYPIALTREALRPGVVFADPYGHILLIAGWVPQPVGGYGVLIGADAQPDGTIGRRRFWQGSFLFDPKHKVVGAGFKSFRPLVGDEWRPLTNEEITERDFGPLAWSKDQYRGERIDFYDRINALSSPRPIAARVHLTALADALYESARRRVLSVNNGEDWIKRHPRRRMKMPSGYSIFLTSGPWEDFATPSRDMRLLIALDTVLDIPSALRRNPARFGVTPDRLEAEVSALNAELERALKARTFQYTKSDGASQTLSLWDLTQRLAAFEVAYNPNDCVETRWGAPEGSEERSTCERVAPRSQKRKMKRYRAWFKDRRRPPRGTR